METLIQKTARLEFALRAEIAADLRHKLMLEMNARVRRQQDQVALEKERREGAEFVAAVQAVFATPQRVAEFAVKLDRYETATVHALMDNERDFRAVREKIEAMLLKAHVIPDGRRVFKTEDGMRVFDEFGAEIDAEQLAPAEIDDKAPRWEAYNAAGIERDRLVAERKELIDYQAKLDAARERTGDPSLTEDELSVLDKQLGEVMPERAREFADEHPPGQKHNLAGDQQANSAAPIGEANWPIKSQASFQP